MHTGYQKEKKQKTKKQGQKSEDLIESHTHPHMTAIDNLNQDERVREEIEKIRKIMPQKTNKTPS